MRHGQHEIASWCHLRRCVYTISPFHPYPKALSDQIKGLNEQIVHFFLCRGFSLHGKTLLIGLYVYDWSDFKLFIDVGIA